ncbi:MAG: nucleotidyltransferase substrate binding protein [Chromatiaceae bacterium]
MSAARLTSLGKALTRLDEALALAETDVTRDAAIQRFEFCYELAWKAVREALVHQGLSCTSPRGCLRDAFKQGWVADETTWLTALEDRNLTSHTYDEALARAIYSRLPGYAQAFRALHDALATAWADDIG